MRFLWNSIFLILFMAICLAGYTNCSQGFTAAPTLLASGARFAAIDYRGKNQVPITIGSCSYQNAPCVSVTVCVPGTSSCSTIDRILLDTGSTGLRVFKQALSLSLTNIKDPNGRNYGQCMKYIGGSSNWGPVVRADIQLAGEKASNVPMQIIDSAFSIPPTTCTNLDTNPEQAGFNGILGVGLFVEDCGAACVNQAGLEVYYSCTAAVCTSSTMTLANQVTNPVALMPEDNNGVVITFPTVPASGAMSLTGVMTLGVGTQSNNTVSGATVLKADASGNFTTVFDGKTYSGSFIDSGSNALFFPQPSTAMATCSETVAPGFYCPASPRSFSATMRAASGGASKQVSFEISNAEALLTTGNLSVLPDLGGNFENGSEFDWGLPFYLGRTVVTTIEGRNAVVSGTSSVGPFWAF